MVDISDWTMVRSFEYPVKYKLLPTYLTLSNFILIHVGEFGINGPKSVFVSPELSEVRQVAVHHFPVVPVPANVEFDFIIAKNGAHGNIAVKVSFNQCIHLI